MSCAEYLAIKQAIIIGTKSTKPPVTKLQVKNADVKGPCMVALKAAAAPTNAKFKTISWVLKK